MPEIGVFICPLLYIDVHGDLDTILLWLSTINLIERSTILYKTQEEVVYGQGKSKQAWIIKMVRL